MFTIVITDIYVRRANGEFDVGHRFVATRDARRVLALRVPDDIMIASRIGTAFIARVTQLHTPRTSISTPVA